MLNEALKIGLVLLILAVFFWTMERIWPENPQQPRWRRDSYLDVFYWFVAGLFTRTIVSVLGIGIVIFSILTLPRLGLDFIKTQPLWLQGLLILLVGDLIFYWTHRLSHTVPRLWKFHAIHHSPEYLDWLAAARVHPVDSIFHRLAAIAPLYMLGFEPGMLAFYAPLLAIYPIFVHANLRWGYGWLGYIVASPAFHRWHHSSDKAALDKNFSGLFPIFDYIFGTAWFPAKARPERYGLADQEQVPRSLWGQLLYPFR